MNVYFVRHGETEYNVKQITQHAGVLLSDKGRAQAKVVGKRLMHLPLDYIVASPFERAKETVSIIQTQIPHLPLEFSALFREQKQPTDLEGEHYFDPLVAHIREKLAKNIHVPDYRYQDEETFTELKTRAREALQYLASVPAKEVLVVTHGNFLRILFMYILFGEALTHREAEAIRQTLYTDNTGITLCQFNVETKKWRVVTWNDLAHLADE